MIKVNTAVTPIDPSNGRWSARQLIFHIIMHKLMIIFEDDQTRKVHFD